MNFASNDPYRDTLMLLTENTQVLLRIESKIDALCKHLNLDFDPNEAIQELAMKGDKIGAIRLHRSFHRSSLAEAKKGVESLR